MFQHRRSRAGGARARREAEEEVGETMAEVAETMAEVTEAGLGLGLGLESWGRWFAVRLEQGRRRSFRG